MIFLRHPIILLASAMRYQRIIFFLLLAGGQDGVRMGPSLEWSRQDDTRMYAIVHESHTSDQRIPYQQEPGLAALHTRMGYRMIGKLRNQAMARSRFFFYHPGLPEILG